LNKTTKIFTT